MHLRVVSARSGGQIRRYAQLMRSYRGKDGVPTHEVVASLGALSDQAIENLRRALKASRNGEAVVLPSETKAEDWQLKVVANLEYLDLAVAWAMWDSWKLSELLNRLLPRGAEQVPTADILLPLVLQRCIAPGSKLYAQRWFPTTALPELLGVAVEHFNNSRIHRALVELAHIEGELQHELPKRYEQHDGAFAALFVDVTDTYFQGRGGPMAQRDRTKEGLHNVHKIGIVLLCNERGYPLRWQVVAGKRRDPQCIEDMVDVVEHLDWARNVPFVGDRAMGHRSAVARLVASGLKFLTATRVTEIASYTDELPSEAFAEITPTGTELSHEIDIERVRVAAAAAGLERAEDLLFVKDLGVCRRTLHIDSKHVEATEAELNPQELEGGAAFLAIARIFRRRIETKEVANQAALAREQELTRARVTQLLNLLRLDFRLQEQIIRGDFGRVPERVLRQAVRRKSAAAQREIVEGHAEKGLRGSKPFRRLGPREVELRLVAYFNPEMFVDQRVLARERRASIERYVVELNQRLRTVSRTREEVYREVMNKLSGNNVIGVYNLTIDEVEGEGGARRLQVRLEIDEVEWKRRRRYDGFVLLVAHPELKLSATEMVHLYRAKDAVEKDFQTIESVTKLRPVFHHTDPKVRAHVTLCMLALLLERTLEQRLRATPVAMTASECFEHLDPCRLNMLRASPDAPAEYRLTEATEEQRAILRSLRHGELIEQESIQARLKPRDCA